MAMYRVTYNHGLQNPAVIEAESYEEARKLALAHYRKNAGFVETVDMWPTDFVVGDVIEVQEA